MRLVRPWYPAHSVDQAVAQWKWKPTTPTWGCHARFAASCSTPRVAPCCCSASSAHRPQQFTTASIESLVSHSATAAGKKSMPIGADAEGTQTPWSTAECRVQGEEPAALGVGSAVVIHVAGQPPSAPPVEIELLLVGWSASSSACMLFVCLSVYLQSICRATRGLETRPCKRGQVLVAFCTCMPDGFIAACAGKRQSAILHVRGADVFRINLSILPAWPYMYTSTPHSKCLMSRQGESRHI
jgi:hypothetical protein